MATSNRFRIRSVHHGAIPVSDLGRSLNFYNQIFGVRLERLLNASTVALQRGLPEVALITFAGLSGFGLALQYEPIGTAREFEGTIWGIEVTRKMLDRITAELGKRGVSVLERSAAYSSHLFEGSISFYDPDGNAFDVFVPKYVSPSVSHDEVALRYVSIEADDMNGAKDFYRDVLGLGYESSSENQLILSVGDSHRIVIRKVKQMSSRIRLVKGPHVALEVDLETFDSLYPSIHTPERYWQLNTASLPWIEPWKRVGYFYDCCKNRLALVVP